MKKGKFYIFKKKDRFYESLLSEEAKENTVFNPKDYELYAKCNEANLKSLLTKMIKDGDYSENVEIFQKVDIDLELKDIK